MTLTTNVYVNRTFNCSANELFNWITQPELIAQWFGPKNLKTGKVFTDVVEGGTFSIQLIQPNDNWFFIKGKYLEIIPSELLRMSFSYKELPTPPPDSEVIFKLHSTTEKTTELSLIQKFETVPQNMEKRTESWELMLYRLSELTQK